MTHFVNLNATWDTVLLLDSLKPGGVNRARAVLSYPGGKGNNAARAAAVLGGHKPSLFAFCGKKDRAEADAFYKKHKVNSNLVAVVGRNRPCVITLDAARDEETVINSPSQIKIKPADLKRLTAQLLKKIAPGELCAFAGSVPEGLRPSAYGELIRAVQLKGGIAMLDAYGPALKFGVQAAPFLVKVNALEVEESFGWSCRSRLQILGSAAKMLRFGVRAAVITMGARGAIVATPKESLLVSPLPESRGWHSPVGCGDAFFGGLAWGLDKGLDFKDCLRWATAAAWATLHSPGAAFFDRALAKAQVGHVRISRITA